MTVRSVVVLPAPLRPGQHGRPSSRRVEVDALQDVIAADMRVHALKRERRAHAAFSGLTPR